MPNRIIREGWIDSERISQLSPAEETFFLRLCLRADDYGRFTAHIKVLKAELYPLADEVRDTDMTRRLAACEKAGLVRCYEVNGKRYVEIADFRQQMRAKNSKYPAPSDGVPAATQTPSERPAHAQQMRSTCAADATQAPSTCALHSESDSESHSETETKAREGPGKPSRSRTLSPPTLDEVRQHCAERKSSIDPEKFHAHYDSNGWKQASGRPIVNWKAAVITWEKNERERGSRPSGNGARGISRSDEGPRIRDDGILDQLDRELKRSQSPAGSPAGES